MSEKIFEPETIKDQPFPGDDQTYIDAGSTSSAGQTYKPATTPEGYIPTKRIATELLSTTLNTKSKKIQGNYGFTKSGAIQVGEYENGVSGEVKMSSDGIVARNKAGITTFAIDGDTGDATFAGTVQAGSFISDSLITGEIDVGRGTGFVRLDGANNRIIVNDGTTNRIVIGNV